MSELRTLIEQGIEPAKVRKIGFYTYMCYTLRGDLTKCMIKRIYEPDENTIDIDYPDGNANFQFNWDDRETYVYTHRKY